MATPSVSPTPAGGAFAVNVGRHERLASVAAGGLLVACGLSKQTAGGLLLAAAGGAVAYRGISGHCGLYQSLGRSTVDADEHGHTPSQTLRRRGVHVEVSFTVARPRHDLYAYWQDLAQLPAFMKHVQSVIVLSPTRSRWVTAGPAGTTVAWEADVINDVPDELIVWHSVAGGDVDTAGSIRFRDAPGSRGTEVRVSMSYVPPGGRLGAVVAKLFGRSGEAEVREDLRRFKALMETGEIATIAGQSHGSRSALGKAASGR